MKKTLALIILAVTVTVLLVLWLSGGPRPQKIAVDFANRKGGALMPAMYFGAGGVGSTLSDAEGIRKITSIQLLGNRIFAPLDVFYKTGSANFTAFDGQLARGTQAGLSPIIVITGTPPNLGSSYCAMPTDVNQWAKYAAELSAHVESLYPGQKYEIWNEPDSSVSLCSSDPLNNYLSIYAAAAPAVKKTLKPGGMVGGPALASPAPNNATWIPAFLGDSRTAPYVDFYSWHLYITGQWDIDQRMDLPYLLKATQGANGLSYYYRDTERYVRAGKQPNAATTPIYITEYNSNWAYKPTCCQSSNAYGALWNAIAVTDWMNVVNDGAQRLPDRLVFFMASDSKNYFCLLGILNDQMNCQLPASGQTFQTYPQYAAYQLFTDPVYLGLETGATVLPTPALPAGLIGATFYTANADDMVLINPGDKAISTVIRMDNLGIRSLRGQEFSLTQGMLRTRTMQFEASTPNTATAVTIVPAYGIVALSLRQ